MPIILLIIVLLTYSRCEDDLHKFQQNSYRFKRYLKWRFETPSRIVRPHELLFVLGFLFTIWGNAVLAIIGCVLMCLDAYFYWLIKTAYPVKKKLVYTPRVKRLKVTLTILLALVAVGGFYWSSLLYVGFIGYFTSFIYVFIAAAINMPIESAVNKYYFDDARRTLAKAPNLNVIGITGSYGKTSTKNVLYKMLSRDFNVLMTPESFNTKMGLTRTLREGLKPIHNVFLAEMGAKEVGDIKELCDFVQPNMGIITSIGPQHLETFKSLDNVIRTKGELFENITQNGTIYVNCDEPNILKLPKRSDVTAYRYAVDRENALQHHTHFAIENLVLNQMGSAFTLVWSPDGYGVESIESINESHDNIKTATNVKTKIIRINLKTKLLGRHNLSNVVAGCAVALTLGVSPERLPLLVSEVEPVEHRLSHRRVADQYTLLDDAFNSNPIGAAMALEVLKAFEGNKKIIITPGMIELGNMAETLNQTFGEQIADVCDAVILVGIKQTQPIWEGLKNRHFPEHNIYRVKSIHEAYARLNAIVAIDDVVLIENDLPDSFNEAL